MELKNLTRHVLGIDCGGSKTVCLLMDESRRVAGRGEAGPSNFHTSDPVRAWSAIHKAMEAAVAQVDGANIQAACFGMAGVSHPATRETVLDVLQVSPFGSEIDENRVFVCGDYIPALVGGTDAGVGVLVNAGTGSIAFGRNQAGKTRRAGGWGYIADDAGGAYDIARNGVKAALRAADGRAEETELTRYIIEYFEVNQPMDVVNSLYDYKMTPARLAGFAPFVIRAAEVGDIVADRILHEAAHELVSLAAAVTEALFNRDEDLDVVTAGGVLTGSAVIRQAFATEMSLQYPSARTCQPKHEPAFGACLLALRSLGLTDFKPEHFLEESPSRR